MLERARGAASFRVVLLAVTLALAVAFPVGTASASVDGEPSPEEPNRKGAYYRRMGMFREAAKAYERYVERSRAEGIGKAAFKEELALAARLRMALGDSDQAALDVERFDQLFGHLPKRDQDVLFPDEDRLAVRSHLQAEAAELLLELGAHYAERHNLAWQASYWQRTLRSEAVHKSLAHRIRAEVKLAQVRWRQSCPVAGQDGLCVGQEPLRMPKSRLDSCDAGWLHLERPRVLARNAALAGAALQGTRRALAAYPVELVLTQRRNGDAQLRLGDQALREAVEAALLIQADEHYERFRASDPLAVPSVNRWPTGQFSAWLKRRQAQLDALRPRYRDLMILSDGEAGLAAAARLAQAVHLFWGDLKLAPVEIPHAPPKPRDLAMSTDAWRAQFRNAYCANLEFDYVSSPIYEPYARCIKLGMRSGVRTPWLTQCERGAHILARTEAPIPSEMFRSEFDIPIVMDRAPIQTSPKPSP